MHERVGDGLADGRERVVRQVVTEGALNQGAGVHVARDEAYRLLDQVGGRPREGKLSGKVSVKSTIARFAAAKAVLEG